MSVNRVFLVGRLGAAPELKTTTAGKAVCSFNMATDGWNGESKEAEWHSVVAWERQAQLCHRYLDKGRLVAVEGRLATRSWNDEKTGVKRFKTEIVASRVTFLGGQDGRATEGGGARGDRHTGAGAGPREVRDDLPF